jgi:hypothetical protein
MKIALLNDFKEYAGAEESIKTRLKYVPANLKVDFKVPNDELIHDDYDAFILENVVMFKMDKLKPIVDSKPYIKVEHDYGYCAMRNLIDCRNCDLPCPAQTVPFLKDMYEHAKVVISQSPAHMRVQQTHLSGWKVRHDCCLMITYKNVQIPKVERKPKSVAFLGTMRSYKGIYDIVNLAGRKLDYQFDFAGRIGCVKPPYSANVKIIGPVEDKWKYLAEHEYFIHVPHMLDPCPASVTEAILMGCKLIINNNVGNITFPYRTREEWIKALDQSSVNYWKKVSNIFNNK